MRLVVLTVLIFSLGLSAAHARIWTDRQGRTFEGELLDQTRDHILVRRAVDGREGWLAISILSDADQKFVASSAKPLTAATEGAATQKAETPEPKIAQSDAAKEASLPEKARKILKPEASDAAPAPAPTLAEVDADSAVVEAKVRRRTPSLTQHKDDAAEAPAQEAATKPAPEPEAILTENAPEPAPEAEATPTEAEEAAPAMPAETKPEFRPLVGFWSIDLERSLAKLEPGEGIMVLYRHRADHEEFRDFIKQVVDDRDVRRYFKKSTPLVILESDSSELEKRLNPALLENRDGPFIFGIAPGIGEESVFIRWPLDDVTEAHRRNSFRGKQAFLDRLEPVLVRFEMAIQQELVEQARNEKAAAEADAPVSENAEASEPASTEDEAPSTADTGTPAPPKSPASAG
ncbi:MAG: hypothetical protein ACFBZ8_12885 [Opitutales bacterium]